MSSLGIHPVKRRRLYEELVDQLTELIVSGRVPPGTQLPSERELVEQFGVGRSAVREALFALQKMGMVTLNSGERACVVAPTSGVLVNELAGAVRYCLSQPDGVRDFQGARVFLEVGLARHAAMHATPDEREVLHRALRNNEEALGDTERFIDTDVAFHYVLAEIAHNPIFTTLLTALAEWLRGQRASSVSASGSPEAAVAAHGRIFRAIAAKDPDAAEREMRAHLQQVSDFFWQLTDERRA
jgi:GntR family transcriptional regulator, sialic acid-inducible nan operon repressor